MDGWMAVVASHCLMTRRQQARWLHTRCMGCGRRGGIAWQCNFSAPTEQPGSTPRHCPGTRFFLDVLFGHCPVLAALQPLLFWVSVKRFVATLLLIPVSVLHCVWATWLPPQVPFAHDVAPASDLLSAVQQLRPTVLVGVSTMAGAFTQEVVEAMASLNTRPIIFPLSNPTSKSECSFEQAVSIVACLPAPAYGYRNRCIQLVGCHDQSTGALRSRRPVWVF